MSIFMKPLMVGILSLGIAGAANAASCQAEQKALSKLGVDIQSIQKSRAQIVADFEFHNDERAAARSDLSMLQMTGGQSDDVTDLEAKVDEHDTAAEALKLELDELNVGLMEKAEVYNAKIEKFNKDCVS